MVGFQIRRHWHVSADRKLKIIILDKIAVYYLNKDSSCFPAATGGKKQKSRHNRCDGLSP